MDKPRDQWFENAEIDFRVRRGEFIFNYRNLNREISINDPELDPYWGMDFGGIDYDKISEKETELNNKWELRKTEILELVKNILIAEASKYLEEYKDMVQKLKDEHGGKED